MDNRSRPKQPRICVGSPEVSSIEWEFINLSEEEEDLVYRMYRLVGDSSPSRKQIRDGRQSWHQPPCMFRWSLIAGRIPGRKPEEIERFWIMRHEEGFAEKRQRRAR